MFNRLFGMILILFSGLILNSCLNPLEMNFFDPFDTPTSDAQILSHARACFDQGDLECAREYYAKLSDSYSDQRLSEEAFTAFEESGIGMGKFLSAFVSGDKGTGGAITKIASDLSNNGGEALRLTLFHALQKSKSISNIPLRGLVKFVGGVALFSEILGETVKTKGTFAATDIATNPTSCKSISGGATGACFTSNPNPCGQPAWGVLVSGSDLTYPASAPASEQSLEWLTDAQVLPTTKILYAAFQATNAALVDLGVTTGGSNEVFGALGASGVSLMLSDPNGFSSPCFRQLMLNQDFGS